MVTSASDGIANATHQSPFYYCIRQCFYAVLGVSLLFAVLTVRMAYWQRWATLALPLALALLLLVFVPVLGREVNGSRRWITLGNINLQSSEVAKVLVIMYMASYLSRKQDEVRDIAWWGFVRPVLVLGCVLVLLLLEPDFGSSVVLFSATMGMVFLAGSRLVKFFPLLLVAFAGAVLLVWMAPYRLRRLATYTDPWADQFGDGYQLTQALIAFGRGGWFGEGLGKSIQKLFFLPEAHTDFIFAVIAEEFGLVGTLAIVAALFFIPFRALRIGYLAECTGRFFSAYLAYGIACLWACQLFINMGVNCGLLPTKGIALPLFSYGGSSLIISCFSIGLLLRIDFERRLSCAPGK